MHRKLRTDEMVSLTSCHWRPRVCQMRLTSLLSTCPQKWKIMWCRVKMEQINQALTCAHQEVKSGERTSA